VNTFEHALVDWGEGNIEDLKRCPRTGIFPVRGFFFLGHSRRNAGEYEQTSIAEGGETMKKAPVIIAFRKTCSADGTGLSHYILMEKKQS